MASAEIAIVCGLKVQVGCQDRLCENSDDDQVLLILLFEFSNRSRTAVMSSTVDLLTTNIFDNSLQYRHNASDNKIY